MMRPKLPPAAVVVAVTAATCVVLMAGDSPLAFAGTTSIGVQAAAATSLDQVMTNLRNLIIGLLAGAATLFFTLGGVRYLGANGDPGEIEKAKRSLRSAAIGYGLAILAPVLLTMLKKVVGQ